jgi:hypothetical protein
MSKASFFYLCKDRDFIISSASRMNLGHTQPTLQWTPLTFIPRDKVAGAQLIPHVHLVHLLYLQSTMCLHVTVVNSTQRHQLPVHEVPKMCFQCCCLLDFVRFQCCCVLEFVRLSPCLYICKSVKCYCIVEAQVFWTASVVLPEVETFVAVKCTSCWKMSDGRWWIPFFIVWHHVVW